MAMYAVYPSLKNMPARLRAFVDFLVASFGNKPFWDNDILKDEELLRVS